MQGRRAQQHFSMYLNFTLSKFDIALIPEQCLIDSKYTTVCSQVHLKISKISLSITEQRILLHWMAQGMNHGSQYNVLHLFGNHSTEQHIFQDFMQGREKYFRKPLFRRTAISLATQEQYKTVSPKTATVTHIQQLLVYSQCLCSQMGQN